MTKTRKTLLISFLILSVILVTVGSFVDLEHCETIGCRGMVSIGLVLITAALGIAMWRPRTN